MIVAGRENATAICVIRIRGLGLLPPTPAFPVGTFLTRPE
jgi:hypothetical protein